MIAVSSSSGVAHPRVGRFGTWMREELRSRRWHGFQMIETTVGEALHRMAEVTLEALPGANVAGMSMLGDDRGTRG